MMNDVTLKQHQNSEEKNMQKVDVLTNEPLISQTGAMRQKSFLDYLKIINE